MSHKDIFCLTVGNLVIRRLLWIYVPDLTLPHFYAFPKPWWAFPPVAVIIVAKPEEQLLFCNYKRLSITFVLMFNFFLNNFKEKRVKPYIEIIKFSCTKPGQIRTLHPVYTLFWLHIFVLLFYQECVSCISVIPKYLFFLYISILIHNKISVLFLSLRYKNIKTEIHFIY